MQYYTVRKKIYIYIYTHHEDNQSGLPKAKLAMRFYQSGFSKETEPTGDTDWLIDWLIYWLEKAYIDMVVEANISQDL